MKTAVLYLLLTLCAYSQVLPPKDPLFMRMKETPASDFVDQLSVHFKESIIIRSAIADTPITATATIHSLDQALEMLKFLLDVGVRHDQGIYYVGSEDPTELLAVNRGFLDSDGLSVLGSDAAIVGDKVVVRSSAEEVDQARDIIKVVNDRKTLHLRVLVSDVTKSTFDSANEWLRVLQAGVSATVSPAGLSTDYGLNLDSFSAFIAESSGSSIEVDTVVTMSSGGSTDISVVDVIEREVNEVVPSEGSETRFRTSFDRLPIGLELDLAARLLDKEWIVDMTASDSSQDGDNERRVSYEGQFLTPSVGLPRRVLALKRSGKSSRSDRWSLFRRLRKGSSEKSERYLLVLVQAVESPSVELKKHSFQKGRIPSLPAELGEPVVEKAVKSVSKVRKRFFSRRKR